MLRQTFSSMAIALTLLTLATGTSSAQSWSDKYIVRGLPNWLSALFDGHRHASSRHPDVNLHVPGPTSEPVIPLTVTTSLVGVRDFQIDVDLNHDGVFEGRGEWAYAKGRLDRSGTGRLRLHGLVAGRYQARVRVRQGSREAVSRVQDFEVLPPPTNHLPVSFEPNVGQADPAVLFLGRARGQMVFVTAEETVLVMPHEPAAQARELAKPLLAPRAHAPLVQRFRLVGANSWVRPTGAKKLPGIANYFIGNDPTKWRTDIATYQEMVTQDVYPGIDLVYHSSQGRLEYDFRVAPGADPSVITLDFPDVERLTIDDDGVLVVHPSAGQPMRHSAPVMYQGNAAWRTAVKGEWTLHGPRQAGFLIADYDVSRELVIDPLIFSTYLGGSGTDLGDGVGVDAANNVYLIARTQSPNFPVAGPPFQGALAGTADITISKINAAGTALVYCTYLGGSLGEGANGGGIAVDAAGNAYVCSMSDSADYPTTPGAFQTTRTGVTDAVVTKLSPAGTTLVYSTYVGGNSSSNGSAIAIDAAGNAYVTGVSGSNFPTTPGAIQPTFVGSADAIVFKLNPTATALVYATYLGSPTQDQGSSIAVDAAGNAYVSGFTSGTGFPTTPGAFQTTFGGGTTDGFLAKINPTGTTLLYGTYLGGNGLDFAGSVAVDPAGNMYVAGDTPSADFPVTPGAMQSTNAGGIDLYIAKFNPTGTVIYSTYLGGSAGDQSPQMVVDAAGVVYLAAGTSSPNFPLVNPIQATPAGGLDLCVVVLNAAGSALTFSTYHGGSGVDSCLGFARDGTGALIVAGTTTSPNFPTLIPVQAAAGGGNDAFVLKLTVLAAGAGVTISESGGSTNVTEGGASDIYTVVLNAAPTANVTITINPGAQVTVSPATLTFTAANWNVAQTVTVTAVDDAIVEGPHTGTITHSATSTDLAYNGIAIANVVATIADNDVGPPPQPPPSGGGGGGSGANEGNHAGSTGPTGAGEGAYGFGFGGIAPERAPILHGPLADGAAYRVLNASSKQRTAVHVDDADTGFGLLGWSLLLALGSGVILGVRKMSQR